MACPEFEASAAERLKSASANREAWMRTTRHVLRFRVLPACLLPCSLHRKPSASTHFNRSSCEQEKMSVRKRVQFKQNRKRIGDGGHVPFPVFPKLLERMGELYAEQFRLGLRRKSALRQALRAQRRKETTTRQKEPTST